MRAEIEDEMRAAILRGSNTIRPYLVLRIDREDVVNSAIASLALYEVRVWAVCIMCMGCVCVCGLCALMERYVCLTLVVLNSYIKAYDMKKRLRIQFINEEGVDEGACLLIYICVYIYIFLHI